MFFLEKKKWFSSYTPSSLVSSVFSVPMLPGTTAQGVAGQVAETVAGEDWIQGWDSGKIWGHLSIGFHDITMNNMGNIPNKMGNNWKVGKIWKVGASHPSIG